MPAQQDEPGIQLVFTAAPDQEADARLLEVEDDHGRSVNVGHWLRRADGTWALRITASDITDATSPEHRDNDPRTWHP